MPLHKRKQVEVTVRLGCGSEPWVKEDRNESYLGILSNSQDLLDQAAEQRDSPGVDLSQQHHTIMLGWQQMIAGVAGHSCDPVPKDTLRTRKGVSTGAACHRRPGW